MAPIVSSATTSRRAGRSRYGAATNNTVVAIASTITGYSGLEPSIVRPAERRAAAASTRERSAELANHASAPAITSMKNKRKRRVIKIASPSTTTVPIEPTR